MADQEGIELRPREWAERLRGTTLWLLGVVALAVIYLIGWVVVSAGDRRDARQEARENPPVEAQSSEGRVPGFLTPDPQAPRPPAPPPAPPEEITVPAFVDRQPAQNRRRRGREEPDMAELARLSAIVPDGWKGAGRKEGRETGTERSVPGEARETLLRGLEGLLGASPETAAPIGPTVVQRPHGPVLAVPAERATLPMLLRGSVIPVTMARRVQTDGGCYPSAIVRRPVYSREGELLIAAGSLLHGECADALVDGARRLFVRWDRLDTTDGARLDFSEGLPSGALDGSLGAEGQLKTHFWRALRDAALISVVSAGAQLAQPEGSRTSLGSTITDRQIVAAAVAQELSRVAAEQLRRNLERQQTIIVKEGARFNVVLHRDLVFGP